MNVRNYIHLTGNLGADPSTYVLPSGKLSCKFRLATNEYYRTKEGERATRTEWHTIRAYGKLAELFAQHLDKGSQVAIVGSMRYRTWTDKYDQKRLTAEVIASEFTFLSSRRRGQQAEMADELAAAEAYTDIAATAAELVSAPAEEPSTEEVPATIEVDFDELSLNEPPAAKASPRSRKTKRGGTRKSGKANSPAIAA